MASPATDTAAAVRRHDRLYTDLDFDEAPEFLRDDELRDRVQDLLDTEFRLGRLGPNARRYLGAMVREMADRGLDWCLSWSTVQRFGIA